MGKLTTWMAALLLLLVTSQLVVAQHGGHNMGGSSGSNGGSYGHDTDGAMNDFQKMVAVQATAEQRSQFQSWSQNTEAVSQQLQELRSALVTNDFSSRLNALNSAIEKSNSGHHDFVGSLTQFQQSGLKKTIQKLGKTNDEMSKALATAIRELGEATSGAKRAAKM